MAATDSPSLAGTPAGYHALTSGAALYEDPGRAVVRIEGERAARVLNGLVSADIEALRPGQATLTFILTSRGRPLALPTVIRHESAFFLDVSRAALPGLLDHFGTYLPPRFASVDVLDGARRLSLIGPEAAHVEARVTREAGAHGVLPASALLVARAETEGGGFDCIFFEGGAAADDFASALRAAGAVPASDSAFEAWRIEMGIPRFGQDVTGDHLPQETGLVSRAVSFDKGCYTGQEVVARIHYRGRVQRHLLGVEALEAPARAPAPGTRLSRDGRDAGEITSWCESPRFGAIGLAYVRRELGAGDAIRLESTPPVRARVCPLPFT